MNLSLVGRIGAVILAGSTFLVACDNAGAADMQAPVKAPPVPAPLSAWSFEFSPYLWAAGIKGDVALGPMAPLVGVDVGFDTILKHLHMTFMGVFEARYEQWGLIADISYLSERVPATGPLGFVNAKLEDKTFFGTFAAAYRIVDQRTFWIDAVAGGRAWWRSDTLNITAPGPVGLSISRDKSWFDPIIGVRARTYATPQLFFQAYADVGGFGVGAKSDWQLAGLIGYDYNKTVTFFGGYRYLAVNYDRGGYVFDVALSGPVLGATFRF
jgi:hypothetical protein